MLRRPYTVKAKPFSDASDEVDLVWYPCLPGAPDLGRVSVMASQDWDADGQTWLPGGEVPGAAMPYNAQTAKPGALGARVCGTIEMFRDGCPKDETVPPVVYGTNGLPHCCPASVVGSGGGAGGGRATVAWPMASSCEDAPLVVIGGMSYGTLAASLDPKWSRVEAQGGTTYRLTITTETVPQSWILRKGATCGSSVFVFAETINASPYVYDYDPVFDDNLYVIIDGWPPGTYPSAVTFSPTEV